MAKKSNLDIIEAELENLYEDIKEAKSERKDMDENQFQRQLIRITIKRLEEAVRKNTSWRRFMQYLWAISILVDILLIIFLYI